MQAGCIPDVLPWVETGNQQEKGQKQARNYAHAHTITYPPCFGNALELYQKYADDENGMFPKELMDMLFHVIKSWQVLVITVALVAYIFLVNYVARTYRRPRSVSKSKPRKMKAAAVAKSGPKMTPDNADSNESLGLEEE
jgi:hypothetical protein